MAKKLNEINIRPVEPGDVNDLYEIITHPAVVGNLLQLPGAELSETQEWIKKPAAGQHRLVAELNGKVVGSGSITQAQRPRLAHSGHVGMMVHPDYFRQGVGSALLAAYLNLADNWLNLRRVELEVYTDNEPAIRLYEKFGFVIEGKRRAVAFGNGRFQDDYVMARLRHPEPSSLPPTSLPTRPTGPRPAVKIRPVHPNDVTDLYHLVRHPMVARTTLQMPSQEIIQTEDRIHAHHPGLYRRVAEADGHVVGMISIYQNSKARTAHSAGLGMMVSPVYWGIGVGRLLMEAILELADQWLNLKRIDLDVNIDNPAAIRLYERCGFALEGTRRMHTYGDGRWADSHFMGRVRE